MALNQIRTVLVPVNGTNTDAEAVQFACSVARRRKAKVFAIYVIEVKRSLPLDAEITTELERGEQVLAYAEKMAHVADYEIETELLQAREVGAAIVEDAADRQVDVIVMGLQYKLRFGEYHLGNTVPYVMKNAHCRVWIVREAITEMPGPRYT
ncbi:MAG: universal stress protein [Chloroflexi bacterium]|nr:universal stress protein [Chloroflexota bacterium]